MSLSSHLISRIICRLHQIFYYSFIRFDYLFIYQDTDIRYPLFQTEKAVSDIYAWKEHTLRSRNQESAMTELLNSMSEEEILVVADWAMKFLPRKYREGQTDWFGKRGLNWHVSVSVQKKDSSISTLTHVHIFSGPVNQNAATTSTIICDVVKDIMKIVPTASKIHLRSDNAGCYKSTLTLAILHQELSENLITYSFSEAQDGKGSCDRKASHIKSCIKRYVNEGNDVLSAEQMKQVSCTIKFVPTF